MRPRVLLLTGLAVLTIVLWLRPGIDHSPWTMLRLFHAGTRVENFRAMDHVFPSRAIAAGTNPQPFPRRPGTPAPEGQYTHDGKARSFAGFLEQSQTTGLIVLRDGVVVHEQYRLGADERSPFTSWSIAKSFVATLVGMALKDGSIRSLDDRVADYVPEYAGSAWENVRLRDLLRMASAIEFDERYDTQHSDIQRVLQRAYLLGTPVDDIVRGYPAARQEEPPGSRFHYISINTQVLANVLRHATGRRLADDLQDRLWQPLGMESPASWSVDRDDTEIAYCCLNATLRDYARLGQLYLQQGIWQGRPLLPADWVAESTRRTEPWLQPGVARPERGYGYHWWVPPQPKGEYFANGIWGQVVWVDESRRVVIARTAVDPDFEARLSETLAFLRALSGWAAALP